MQIIAHRGASQYAPENTIAAFKKAIEQNADAIELDVQLTKDGIPVINHDVTINRVTNKKGYIQQLELAQLKKIDFGSKFSKQFKHETIATLEEVLQLVKDTNLQLHIELKNGPIIKPLLEEKVLQLVHTYKLEKRVFYSNFDHMSLKKLYTLDTTAKIGLLFFGNLIDLFHYIDHIDFPLHSIHPNHYYVTEQLVSEAKKRHLQLNVYTVNDLAFATRYKEMGIDGLITNNPLIFK